MHEAAGIGRDKSNLEDYTMNVTLTMHSKTSCPYCDEARSFLQSHNIPVAERKHDDDADRAAMYDDLGLVGRDRTVPQFVIRDCAGDEYLVSGVRALKLSGIQSLFGALSTAYLPAAMSAVVDYDAGMVVAEEGHSCCE